MLSYHHVSGSVSGSGMDKKESHVK